MYLTNLRQCSRFSRQLSNNLPHSHRKRLRHFLQTARINSLQLQFIFKRRRIAIIDAIKQRLFRHGKVKSIPRLKTEIEPIRDMGVLNGDSAPLEIAGNNDSRAERDNRTNRGNLDDDPVLVQSPLGADIKKGCVRNRPPLPETAQLSDGC